MKLKSVSHGCIHKLLEGERRLPQNRWWIYVSLVAGKAFDDYIEAKGNGISCSSGERAPQFARRQDARDFVNEFNRTKKKIMALWFMTEEEWEGLTDERKEMFDDR